MQWGIHESKPTAERHLVSHESDDQVGTLQVDPQQQYGRLRKLPLHPVNVLLTVFASKKKMLSRKTTVFSKV